MPPYYKPASQVRGLNGNFSWGAFLGGLLVGAFLIAPFIWTPLGRQLAIESIRRGARVTREKVMEWLERGERGEGG